MDATAERILEATVLEAASHGLQRVTMDGVAKRAGLNRATVYRHFKDRDGLVAAMAARDARLAAAVLTEAFESGDDPLEDAFVGMLRFVRSHPFITRAAKHEPGWLIEAGRSDDNAMFKLAVALVSEQVPPQVAETLVRLFVSLVLLPETIAFDIDDEGSVRAYVHAVIAPIASARRTDSLSR
jgi:TetR/AcrR family transcriptional repressor of uid operon